MKSSTTEKQQQSGPRLNLDPTAAHIFQLITLNQQRSSLRTEIMRYEDIEELFETPCLLFPGCCEVKQSTRELFVQHILNSDEVKCWEGETWKNYPYQGFVVFFLKKDWRVISSRLPLSHDNMGDRQVGVSKLKGLFRQRQEWEKKLGKLKAGSFKQVRWFKCQKKKKKSCKISFIRKRWLLHNPMKSSKTSWKLWMFARNNHSTIWSAALKLQRCSTSWHPVTTGAIRETYRNNTGAEETEQQQTERADMWLRGNTPRTPL